MVGRADQSGSGYWIARQASPRPASSCHERSLVTGRESKAKRRLASGRASRTTQVGHQKVDLVEDRGGKRFQPAA